MLDALRGLLQEISIHALREEGDSRAARTDGILHDFYPRPPRGGRRKSDFYTAPASTFLSTPSARRATPAIYDGKKLFYFYPRPPRGGRPGVPSTM